MPEIEKIATAPGLDFDILTAGQPGAPLVVLLHGFAESMSMWHAQVQALADVGYRAVAPNQRGYSPGARPDTSVAENYHLDRLVEDAMAIAAVCGYGERRFHLVGHDWGGSVSWALADRFPQRLATLTVLSQPHPNAFNRALELHGDNQAQRSQYEKTFLEPEAADLLLADKARQLRERLSEAGVPTAAVEETLGMIGNKPAMEAALNWYRASEGFRKPLGPIRVPTLYIWGDADDTIGRIAAEGTQDFIAAPYRLEVLTGVGHFAADQVPNRVNKMLLSHFAAHPA